MKHIKLFETAEEFQAAEIATPFVGYIKETDSFEMVDIQPIEKGNNPEFLALCYSKGWCENPNYMTLEECAAVTNTQFNSLSKTDLTSIKSLEELKYFTGLTTLPKPGLFDTLSNLTVVHFPDQIVDPYSTNGNLFQNCSNLVKVVFPSELTKAVFSTSYGLFRECNNVVNLDFSNTKITTLNQNVYYSNTSNKKINSLQLPKTYTTPNNIFSTTIVSINWVKYYMETPVAQTQKFTSSTRIYVPDASVDAYKASSAYANYVNNIFSFSQWEEDIENEVISL